MKRLFIVLIMVVALALVISYIFIPPKIKITAVEEGSVNLNAATRYLLKDKNWAKWWPSPNVFHYKNAEFRIDKELLNSFEMLLFYRSDTIKNILRLIPLGLDSTGFAWSCEIEASNNPIKRWARYLKAHQIKSILNVLIESLKNHLEKEENIYGIKVNRVKVIDSVLISTRSSFDHYPDNKEIDIMIQKLKNYIKSEKALEKNYPMLNVYETSRGNYDAMIAIATDRTLPATTDFTPKHVLKGGKLLEAEFKGGPYAIKQAFDEFEKYRMDFQLLSPAIPYQMMITDRAKETDTSKWLTKFYYPVF
jgi:hypothetical protein